MLRRAVKRCSDVDTDIKWLNDLCIQGRKVAGILCEVCHGPGKQARTILGIGLNIHDPGFEGSLRTTACWLDEFTSQPLSPEAILQAFLGELQDYLADLPGSCWLDEYRSALLWKNRRILLVQGSAVKERVLRDIDRHGCLVVTRDGCPEVVCSGEVHLLLSE